jgi:hypothetical protein
MTVDAAVALVSTYLQLNGYFLVTEFEIHARHGATLRSLTDLDILAVRPPTARGSMHYAGAATGAVECEVITEIDPGLEVAVNRFDVVVAEVKQGQAAFNPTISDTAVLHAALRRIGDVFGTPIDQVVDGLLARGRVSTRTAQVRLLAFGEKGSTPLGRAMTHGHVLDFVTAHLLRRPDLSRATTFSDPVLAVLELILRNRSDQQGPATAGP